MKIAIYTEEQLAQAISNIDGIVHELQNAEKTELFNIHIDLDNWYVRAFENEKDLTDFIVAETDDSDNALVIYTEEERGTMVDKLHAMAYKLENRANPESCFWLLNFDEFSANEYESKNELTRAENPGKDEVGRER